MNILPFDSIESIGSFCDFNIYRIGTIGDGSCLLHSIMTHEKEYRKLSEKMKSKYIKKLRKKLYKIYDEKSWENTGNGSLKLYSNIDKSYTYKKIKKRINSLQWMGDEYIDFISNYININIFIIIIENNHIIKLNNFNINYNPLFDSIIILYLNNHYESILIENTFVLKHNHPIILNLLQS
jgi:hypothetical protein